MDHQGEEMEMPVAAGAELPPQSAPAPANPNPLKRPADSESSDGEASGNDADPGLDDAPDTAYRVSDLDALAEIPLSKNQLRRLRKRQRWQERKQDRTLKRKEKKQDKQARKRSEREAKLAEAQAADLDPNAVPAAENVVIPSKRIEHVTVPVAFILDCDFESYMRERELVSLSGQIVRSYSVNKQAGHRAHFYLAGWKGMLRKRFEKDMKNTHRRWKGVQFVDAGFREAAAHALDLMKGPKGGKLVDVLEQKQEDEAVHPDEITPNGHGDSAESPQLRDALDERIVYLTADSPYTLERLEPHTCYVIGGIVDKNREKGLCQRRAVEAGVRTAKLPIGQYMRLQQRAVLATNHVVEILSNWLDSGDWVDAFFKSIPKRKGGVLKEQSPDNGFAGHAEEDEEGKGELEEAREAAEVWEDEHGDSDLDVEIHP